MYHFLKLSFLVEMSSKMRSLDREVRGLKMEKEDIERVSFILFYFLPLKYLLCHLNSVENDFDYY